MRPIPDIIIEIFSVLCFIVIVIFFCNTKNIKELPPSDTLTVMTYNLHQGFDNTGKVGSRAFLRVIKKANPDIIGLQETETNRLMWGSYDLVYWLASKLNMFYYYGPPTKRQTYGVSILSKYPLHNSKTCYLESKEDHWVLVESEIIHKNREIQIMVVHLGISIEDQFNQTKWILEKKIKRATRPVILLGDFNMPDWEDFSKQGKPKNSTDNWYRDKGKLYESLKKKIYEKAKQENFHGMADYRKYLIDTWRLLHPNDVNAFSWFDSGILLGVPREKLDPSVRIDYIYVSKDFNVLESSIINNPDTMNASDHLPILSVLTLK